MNELNQQIEELEAQERNLDTQIANATDDADVRELTDRRNIITNRLNELREELRRLQEEQKQRADQIEEKVYAEGIPFSVVGVDLVGIPEQVIKLVESIVMADRRRIYNEHAIELEQLESERDSLKNVVEHRGELLDQAEQNIVRLQIEIDEYRVINDSLRAEKEDAEAKRDAAVYQLEAANKEIERLKAEIEDYQRAKEWGERQAQHVINVTPEENNTISAAAEAVKKLFTRTEDWGSVIKAIKPDGTFEVVKRDELANEWEPIDLPEVPDFQSETNTDRTESPELGEDTSSTGIDVGDAPESTVTRAEFEALKRRVDAIEDRFAPTTGAAA